MFVVAVGHFVMKMIYIRFPIAFSDLINTHQGSGLFFASIKGL
jgi:hypothetical protein